MKRRSFFKRVLGLGAVAVAPLLRVSERAIPVRCAEAFRTRIYPGHVRRFDKNEAAKPAKWAG